jgi:hypothetical protein
MRCDLVTDELSQVIRYWTSGGSLRRCILAWPMQPGICFIIALQLGSWTSRQIVLSSSFMSSGESRGSWYLTCHSSLASRSPSSLGSVFMGNRPAKAVDSILIGGRFWAPRTHTRELRIRERRAVRLPLQVAAMIVRMPHVATTHK